MAKKGIQIEVPGHGLIDIRRIVTDYTGTHAFGGLISEESLDCLRKLATSVDIDILTSDTFGTCRTSFESAGFNVGKGNDVNIVILEGENHDNQKADYVRNIGASNVAAFGNGQNDRGMLAVVKEARGLSVAVENGEGCAWDAMRHSHLFIHGSVNALMLLLDTGRLKATLRF